MLNFESNFKLTFNCISNIQDFEIKNYDQIFSYQSENFENRKDNYSFYLITTTFYEYWNVIPKQKL